MRNHCPITLTSRCSTTEANNSFLLNFGAHMLGRHMNSTKELQYNAQFHISYLLHYQIKLLGKETIELCRLTRIFFISISFLMALRSTRLRTSHNLIIVCLLTNLGLLIIISHHLPQTHKWACFTCVGINPKKGD